MTRAPSVDTHRPHLGAVIHLGSQLFKSVCSDSFLSHFTEVPAGTWGPYTGPGREPKLARCKASVLPTVLYVWLSLAGLNAAFTGVPKGVLGLSTSLITFIFSLIQSQDDSGILV